MCSVRRHVIQLSHHGKRDLSAFICIMSSVHICAPLSPHCRNTCRSHELEIFASSAADCWPIWGVSLYTLHAGIDVSRSLILKRESVHVNVILYSLYKPSAASCWMASFHPHLLLLPTAPVVKVYCTVWIIDSTVVSALCFLKNSLGIVGYLKAFI